MPRLHRVKPVIVTGSTYPEFAVAVAGHLDTEITPIFTSAFPSTEANITADTVAPGSSVYVFQAHSAERTKPGRFGHAWSVDQAVMEHSLILDAIKPITRRLTGVAPYLGYSRSDEFGDHRRPIAAKRVISMLSSANTLMSLDLHAPQLQGFTQQPYANLEAPKVISDAWLKNWVEERGKENVVIAAPSADGGKYAREYVAELGGVEVVFVTVDKDRYQDEVEVEAGDVVGNVKGKHVIILDDLIDTGKIAVAAAEKIKDEGAESVISVFTHGILSEGSLEAIKGSQLETVVVTNTVPQGKNKAVLQGQLQVIDVTKLHAEAVYRTHHNKSISALFPEPKKH